MGLVDNIKKAAQGNKTKIQSTEAADLEKILNQLFFKDKNIEEETKFVKQVMTRGLETQERVGLHASAMLVGEKDFCLRAQVLSLIYKQSQGEGFNAGLMRIFEEGNAIHEKWQRLIIRGGYGKAKHMDFTRMNEDYMLSYTPDIICKIPEFYDGPMVGEIKSVNTFQFQKMTKHPSAWKQDQWYMHLTGIHKGFVLCEDKNSQDFKVELYDYDPLLVAPFIERAESIMYHYDRVFEVGKMVSRPDEAKLPTCKKCKDCFMKDACWGTGKGRIKLEDNTDASKDK